MDDIAIACQLNKEGRPLPIANPVYRDVRQEVSGQVEGIFSDLTEEEKEEIRKEYTLDDNKYSSDVHRDLPPPSAGLTHTFESPFFPKARATQLLRL